MKRAVVMWSCSALLVITAAAAAICFFMLRQPVLTITHEEAGELVFLQPVEAGDRFMIRFIHSVHRTPVEEHFRISADRTIILERVVYETYGVGNPSGPAEGETYRREDGKIIIEDMNRRMEIIYQRIGQIAADHSFTMRDRCVPFAAWSEPGSRVIIRVDMVSLWRVFAASGKGW